MTIRYRNELSLLIVLTCILAVTGIEENTTFNLTRTLSGALDLSNISSVRWFSSSFPLRPSDPLISECFPHNGSCTNNFGPGITATVVGRTSTISISNVSRVLYPSILDQRQYWFYVSIDAQNNILESIYTYLSITASPQKLDCTFQIINQTTVQSFCLAQKIYPPSGCYAMLSKDNVTFYQLPGEVRYLNTLLNGTPQYYSLSCNITWTLFFLQSVNYLKVRFNFVNRSESDTFVFTPDLRQLTTTGQPTTQQSSNNFLNATGPSINVATDSSSDRYTGLAVGLGLTTGLSASVALLLGLWLFYLKRRSPQSQKETNGNPVSPSLPPFNNKHNIPAGYSSCENDTKKHYQNDETDHAYEKVYQKKDVKSTAQDQSVPPVAHTVQGIHYINMKGKPQDKTYANQNLYAN